jgi:hypothetical protein
MEIYDLVAQVVEENVDNEVLFTAWDVTLAANAKAKKQGIDGERHKNIKRKVHEIMNDYVFDGTYLRTYGDAGENRDVQAFIYHPVGTDIEDYLSSKRTVAVNVKTPVTKAPIAKKAKDLAIAGRAVPDNRGRICVPAKVVREAGYMNGDTVSVLFGPKAIAIIGEFVPNYTGGATYIVDRDDNIRISSAIWSSAFKDAHANSVFEFTVDGETIRVSLRPD